MIHVNRIVCAIDFSECSRRALDYAAAIARGFEAELTALHVFVDRLPVDIIPPLGARPMATPIVAGARGLRKVQRQLERFVGRRKDVDIAAEAMESSDVRDEILARSDQLKADLVVVGTHGRSGVATRSSARFPSTCSEKRACRP